MALKLRLYIPAEGKSMGFQGDEEQMPDSVNTKEKYNSFKQKMISDFISKFKQTGEIINDKGARMKLVGNGVGIYKDNKFNRSKRRVGMSYDKDRRTAGLRRIVENPINYKVADESGIMSEISRPKAPRIPLYAVNQVIERDLKGVKVYVGISSTSKFVRFTRAGKKAWGFFDAGKLRTWGHRK